MFTNWSYISLRLDTSAKAMTGQHWLIHVKYWTLRDNHRTIYMSRPLEVIYVFRDLLYS